MSIVTLDGYIAAAKQTIPMYKSATRTTVAYMPFTMFDIAGQPGAGTLAGTSTGVGVVPTDGTAGCPLINFTSGVGYLSRVNFFNTVASRVRLYDLLFKAGGYAYTTGTTTLATQPSIASRCPDYPGSGIVWGNGCEIWLEVVSAFATGNNWQIQVTYTNSAGTTGRTSIISAAQAAAALTLGKQLQLALQAGDSGVQVIESVIVTNGATAMTAGTFNILIMRPLWSGFIDTAGRGGTDNFIDTGMPIVYGDSAIVFQVRPESTLTGLPDFEIEIASA